MTRLILDAANQGLHHRMIGAHHREAVERHILDKRAKRVLHRIEGLKMIEVLRVNIGNDGDICRELEKGAVGFISLDHHPVAGAQPGVGTVGVDDAAIDHGRIEAAGIE